MKHNLHKIILLLLVFGLSSLSVFSQPSIEQKKKAAINGLVKPDGTNHSVEDALASQGLKGLSVAVFENYKLVWTETWGVKDVVSKNRINRNTAFSTASIAKPITATLLAILEEKGLIDLKAPVSKYLKRWKLPKSEHTENTEVTLEHILSHTAGTSQGGFADYYKGEKIPTLMDSLDGKLPDNEKIKFISKPGTDWSYSGGGYVIAQIAVEDHLGESLADLAKKHLFAPLGLKHTTMKQPNEDGFLDNVAKAHDSEGKVIKTGVPITPQVAPSGVWSTPTEMAVIMIEIQNALRGVKTTVISQKVAKRVTDVVTNSVMGGWGIGWERRFGYGNYDWFSHGGANTGTGGYIYATMRDGNGIAFFGNGPNKIRIPVLDQFASSIIKAHKWHKPIDRSQQIPLPRTLVDMIVGDYTFDKFEHTISIRSEKGKLFISKFISSKPPLELIYIGNGTFLLEYKPGKIRFEVNKKEKVVEMVRYRDGMTKNQTHRDYRKKIK